MKKTLETVALIGEILLGIGVLWMFVSGTFRRDILPEGLQSLESAVLMTGVGVVLWQGGKALARQVDGLPRPAAGTEIAGDNAGPAPEPATKDRMAWVSDRMARDNAASRDRLGAHFGRAQDRVCLRAVWPQRQTGSWVGGLPQMPPGMDWPAFDGRPATFLAQIALEGLPDALWQGLGPRKGWLLFFFDPQNSGHIAIRHVSGPTTARAQPWNVAQNWHFNTEPAGLRGGNRANVPVQPRWFVEICNDPALGAVEDMASENPAFWNDEKGEWIWEETWTMQRQSFMGKITADRSLRFGFDWPSFFCLFDLWDTHLEERRAHYETMIRTQPATIAATEQTNKATIARLEETFARDGTDEARAALETQRSLIEAADKRHAETDKRNRITVRELEAVCAMLPEVEKDLRAAAQDTPWHPDIGAEFHRLTEDLNTRLAEAGGIRLVPLERHWPAVIETYARHLYTTDPEALPPRLHEILAPLWELQAQETRIFMGLNHPGGDGAQPDARLIDLPTNPLSGVHFGDMSRFYVDIPAEALAEGDFTKARATDTHGVH